MQSTAGPIRLVIVGATGMVGGYALRYALRHESVERIVQSSIHSSKWAANAVRRDLSPS